MKLYLVRHGQTPANIAKKLDTALPGPSLTELGHEQARQLAEKLATEPVEAVYASYATRAQQTAAPLAQALGLQVEPVAGVHEIVVGDLEGRNDPAALEQYLSVARSWTRGELQVAMPAGRAVSRPGSGSPPPSPGSPSGTISPDRRESWCWSRTVA